MDRMDRKAQEQPETPKTEHARRPYEAPQLLKKKSVARVTLFSFGGGGTGASGVTTSG